MSFDFGLLQQYVDDDMITDVDSNGRTVYINHIEKGLYKVENLEDGYLQKLLMRLVNADEINEQFNYENPILDGVIDGLRIHATHNTFSTSGYTLRIRKNPLDLVITREMAKKTKYCHDKVFDFLSACMKSNLSVMFGGEVGTGKTQLMKTTLSMCDKNANLVLISDIDEMRMLELYPSRNITQYVVNDIMDYHNTTATILRDDLNYVCFQEVRDNAVDELFLVLSSCAKVTASVHLKTALLMPQRLLQLSSNKNDKHLLSTIHDYIQVCVMPVKEMIDGVTRRYIGEIAVFWNDENGDQKKQLIYKQNRDEMTLFDLPSYFVDYFKTQNVCLNWRV